MADISFCNFCTAYRTNENGDVCLYNNMRITPELHCRANENIVVFGCYMCDALAVDEYGNEHCDLDGRLIVELNECFEEKAFCPECGEDMDWCECGIE